MNPIAMNRVYVLMIIVGLIILQSCVGCQLFSSSSIPSEEYTKADRQFYSVLISETVDFVNMIEDRQDLTATQKAAIKTALDAWEYMIRKAEAAQVKVGE